MTLTDARLRELARHDPGAARRYLRWEYAERKGIKMIRDVRAAVLAEVIRIGPITAARIKELLQDEYPELLLSGAEGTLKDLEDRKLVRETHDGWVKNW